MENQDKNIYIAPTIEEFNQLPIAGQRIAIAKDVIEMVKEKKYKPKRQRYFNWFEYSGSHKTVDSYDLSEKDVQQALPEMKECEVCALGSCILSITKFKNKIKFGDLAATTRGFTSKTDNVIREIFTPEQFAMMEACFEGYYGSVQTDYPTDTGTNYGKDRLKAQVSDEDAKKCIEFYWNIEAGKRAYEEDQAAEQRDKKRLITLMQHIIDNNGEIIPDKL